ncbi:Pkinase-domain-containing protein [Ascodesmis nigricans]|uniref:Pkinase-domain-containing protein n=1 Tax=Ascodesmis nigricans TaxID=341454 RepID=A0A4S2N7L9_9PEZI|nr:Pkinase-domain-containing protein [Ascodesmis nigricans]
MKRDSPAPPPHSQEPPRKKPLAVDPWGRPRFKGCESIRAYDVLGKLGEGTFGEVYKARSHASGKLVALKKILMHNQKEEGFPITALREIKILKMLSHTNVIRLIEMAVERKKERVAAPRGTMYMITPYMEHDLAGLLENKDVVFDDPLVKCYLLQLLEGTKYLHEMHILHRDMKAANLLIDNRGVLKIADFGLARIYDEPVPKPGCGGGVAKRQYTNCVVTRWYRPPELLLGETKYTTAIDLWGVGCVFAEMYKRKPILQGNSDMDQMMKIFHLCGPPTVKSMPCAASLPGYEHIKNAHFQRTLESQHSRMGSAGVSLLSQLLLLDPVKRINAHDATQHEYFRVDPLPLKPGEVPKFNDSHELDGKKNRNHRGALPPAPAGGAVGAPNATSRDPWQQRRPEQWNASGGGGNRRPPAGEPRIPQGASNPAAAGTHRDHRPAWSKPQHQQQSLSQPPQPPPGEYPTSLPPRPPPPAGDTRRGNSERHDRERHHRGGSGPPRDARAQADVDTYFPSYGGPTRGWERDRERRREGSRDARNHDRDRDRDRERDRDRDRDRDRERDRSERGDRDRDRGERERDRGRERGYSIGSGNGRDSVGGGLPPPPLSLPMQQGQRGISRERERDIHDRNLYRR